MLRPEVLAWLYKTQKLLKEKFDLDTSKQKDMGRIRLNQPWRESIFGTHALVYGEKIDEDCKVNNMYACMSRNDKGFEYWEEPPAGGSDQVEWLLNYQGTFHVVENEDGTLELDSLATRMTDEELNELYDNAKDGRIYVNVPGVDILSGDPRCQFLCVSKQGEPLLYDGGPGDFYKLSKEQQEHFLKNHPEIKIRKSGEPKRPGYYGSNDKELLEMAIMEETALKDVENPEVVMNHAEQALQAVSRQNTIEEKNAQYEIAFWYNAHHGLPILTQEEDTLLRYTMKDILVNQVKVDSDFLMGDGLVNFFVEAADGSMIPLFPDHKELKEAADGELEATGAAYKTGANVGQTLLEALKAGPVYVYGPNQQEPTQTRAAEIRLRKNGELRTYVVAESDPVKPAWYKRLLNSINKNWYKDEMEQYRAEKAAHDEGMRHKENAEVARQELLDAEAAQQEINSPQRQELRRKNAQAVKPRNFEALMTYFKKNSLSELSRQVSEEETLGGMEDTFAQLMFINEMENVAKNGTEDAKELLYQLSADGLVRIYNNVFLKAPDVQETLNTFANMTDDEGDSYTINDYLNRGLCNALEQVGDDPKQYDPEDLQLADMLANHLNGERKNLAKSRKINAVDFGKALDQEAKELKAKQVKKSAEKVNDKVKTTEKSGNVLGG